MTPADRVTLVHPQLPGQTIHAHPRSVAAHAKRGWVEPQSPPATADDETTNTSPEGDDDDPSKEELP